MVQDEQPKIEVRTSRSEDSPFIFSNWLHTVRNGSQIGAVGPSRRFFDRYHRVYEKILERPDVEVLVAHPPEDPTLILGFLVHEPGVLHMVFVKEMYRRFGVATRLVEESGLRGRWFKTVFTQKTSDGEAVLKRHPGPKFDPYPLYLED